MRKIVYFTAILLFALIGIYSVISYSNASVENKVALTITDPSNGLVVFVPLKEQLFIRQGEIKEALSITNNLQTAIFYSLDYNSPLYLKPNSGSLESGGSDFISLDISYDCLTGYYTLPITLKADFEGGKAHILTDLPVYVEQGDLKLQFRDDGFVFSWNGGSTPDGTAIFYRYKADTEADAGSEWSGWIKIDENGHVPSEPGYYEYKAVFGETESEIISRNVERPIKDEEDLLPEVEEAESLPEDSKTDSPTRDDETDSPFKDNKTVSSEDDGDADPVIPIIEDSNYESEIVTLPETED